MNRFLQLHLLTSFPPSNVNRDDLGRPKTAIMGGVRRLRISSQSLKRAWRTSETFAQAASGASGIRTKFIGKELFDRFSAAKIEEKTAIEWARAIAGGLGTIEHAKVKSIADELKKADDREKKLLELLQHTTLTFIGPDERASLESLADRLIQEKRAPKDQELALLVERPRAVDIALFGRMLADQPVNSVDAACQVAHGLGVHAVTIEDDYFTAVDDLSARYRDDAGAAHLGETAFAASLCYLYICIDRLLLEQNLSADRALSTRALRGLVEAAATVPPSGHQNSFASRAYASFILAEKGDQQPRSLSVAFLSPVRTPSPDADFARAAIQSLDTHLSNIDKVYGPTANSRYRVDAIAPDGTMSELLEFVAAE